LLNKSIEKFTSINNLEGEYPKSQEQYLVQDFYPKLNKIGLSNNTASDIWWHFPSFKLGSYKQITNNLKYSNNPDEGTCMPSSMCGTFYHNNQLKSNYITPLPPVNPSATGTRVGYFITENILSSFIPDIVNVLY
jgi:hypothetical protein